MRQSYTPGPRPTAIAPQPTLNPLPKTCGQCRQNKNGICQAKAIAGWDDGAKVRDDRRGCGIRWLVEA